MPPLTYTGLSYWIRRTCHQSPSSLPGNVPSQYITLVASRRNASMLSRLLELRPSKEATAAASASVGKTKFYEQYGEGAQPQRISKQDYNQGYDDAEVDALQTQLEEIQEADEEVSGARRKPQELFQEFLEKLPPERQSEIRRGWEEYQAKYDANPEAVKRIENAHLVRFPLRTLSKAQLNILRAFNNSLGQVSSGERGGSVRSTVWKFYERGKIYLQDFTRRIPDTAWRILWLSQSENVSTNPERGAHLRTLVEDMTALGKMLTPEQQHARIEGLFLEGKRDEALEAWESGRKAGNAGDIDFLEIGIRMYALVGNMDRAEELLDVLLKLHPSWNPEIAFPVISSFINQQTEAGHRKAFALYLRLRNRLGSEMTLHHYDAVSLDFLRGHRGDLAIAVIRDMMLCELPDTAEAQRMQQLITEKFHNFMSLSQDVDTVNTLSLTALTLMPRQFQNPFFYAKWMARLIQSGEVHAATQVVELMYERGIKPNAKHINSLLVAFFSSGQPDLQLRGEQIAWNMVQKRLDFVLERTLGNEKSSIANGTMSPKSILEHTLPGVHVPTVDLTRQMPVATSDTFSVLVKYYLRNGNFDNVRHLRNLLVDAQLPITAPFMNSLLYAEMQYRSHLEVWARFIIMSRATMPDMRTYACLWANMKTHINAYLTNTDYPSPSSPVDSVPSSTSISAANDNIAPNEEDPDPDSKPFPTPRALFARMTAWHATLPRRRQLEARDQFDAETLTDIVRCFFLARDLPGAVVALHGLSILFPSTNPDAATVRMVIMQLGKYLSASLGTDADGAAPGAAVSEGIPQATTEDDYSDSHHRASETPGQRRRRRAAEKKRFHTTRPHEAVLAQITALVDETTSRRVAAAEAARGLPFAQLSRGEQGAEVRSCLLEAVLTVARGEAGGVAEQGQGQGQGQEQGQSEGAGGAASDMHVRELVRAAGEEMGVPGFDVREVLGDG